MTTFQPLSSMTGSFPIQLALKLLCLYMTDTIIKPIKAKDNKKLYQEVNL